MVVDTLAVDTFDPAVIQDFAMRHRGPIIRPGDLEYDEARSVRNGMIDRRPGIIARCNGVADVIEAVNLGREQHLIVSIRGGGHNVAGNAVNDGGLVIDLSEMRGVRADPVARTVRVQGGATWGDVDRETQLFGLAIPGGVVSSTGVAGLTLHGGWGWLRRKYGYSLDNLLSVDIVTADGQVRTASEQENPDLFWAVRGAGSNFGVVTSFEFKAHPVGPMVALAAPAYALEDAPDLMPRWREFMEAAPEEVSGIALFWNVPDVEMFPESVRGKPVFIPATVYSGPADEGERALQPLRELGTPMIDLSGVQPYAALQSGFDWAYPKGWRYYWKSHYLDGLSGEVIEKLLHYAADRPTPQSSCGLWQLGGAPSRVPADATAFGRRDAPYLLTFETTWIDAADSERCLEWTRNAWADFRQYGTGLYLNFAGFGEEKEALVRAGYGSNYDRLVMLKNRYDPTNLFRMNQNIVPTVH